MKEKIKLFFKKIWAYFKSLMNLSENTDVVSTIDNISQDVEFKGGNLWVLVFAIIIASVGLNVNSTAVVIGAMLISPLMGPIIGLGLSIGINDTDLLKKSLKNLLIMIFISLFASSIYFLLTPLSDAESELLSRTRPTLYDVFIAFAGGLSGIIAISRKQEKIAVVSGVAIATALMPPLCTAGYGLGTGQFIYFFGAFYLFFINAFFIALSTFVMVHYLHFPKRKYIDPKRERRVKNTIIIVAFIILAPSVFIAISVIKETTFKNSADRYVEDIQNGQIMQNVQIVDKEYVYSRTGNEIVLFLVGQQLNGEQVSELQRKLEDHDISNTNLIIKQAKGGILDIRTQAEMLQDFIAEKDRNISEKDKAILDLKKQLQMEKQKSNISLKQLSSELLALYPAVSQLSMSEAYKVNLSTNEYDTVPTINIVWAESPPEEERKLLKEWLSVRLNNNKLEVINVQ